MPQIHHDLTLPATPSQVYRALLDADDFALWTQAPAEIDATQGGAFLCFGDFILGRNIELVPNQRIVQAWRVFNWEEGVYSIAKFELAADGDGTRLSFDQDGVPEDAALHVDGGWKVKYWDPLAAFLAASSGD